VFEVERGGWKKRWRQVLGVRSERNHGREPSTLAFSGRTRVENGPDDPEGTNSSGRNTSNTSIEGCVSVLSRKLEERRETTDFAAAVEGAVSACCPLRPVK
jgi:hypothetical protein